MPLKNVLPTKLVLKIICNHFEVVKVTPTPFYSFSRPSSCICDVPQLETIIQIQIHVLVYSFFASRITDEFITDSMKSRQAHQNPKYRPGLIVLASDKTPAISGLIQGFSRSQLATTRESADMQCTRRNRNDFCIPAQCACLENKDGLVVLGRIP